MPSRVPRTPSPDRDGDSSSPSLRPAAPEPPENEAGWPITPPPHLHHRRRNALTAATAPRPHGLQRLRRAATHGNPRADLARMIRPSIEHDSHSDPEGGDSDGGEEHPRPGQNRGRTRIPPNPFAPGFRQLGERYQVHQGDDHGSPSSPDDYGWPVTHNPPSQHVVVDQALPLPGLTATAGPRATWPLNLAGNRNANPFATTRNYAVQPPAPEWMRYGRHAQAPRTRPPINQDGPAEAESPASSTSSAEVRRRWPGERERERDERSR